MIANLSDLNLSFFFSFANVSSSVFEYSSGGRIVGEEEVKIKLE